MLCNREQQQRDFRQKKITQIVGWKGIIEDGKRLKERHLKLLYWPTKCAWAWNPGPTRRGIKWFQAVSLLQDNANLRKLLGDKKKSRAGWKKKPNQQKPKPKPLGFVCMHNLNKQWTYNEGKFTYSQVSTSYSDPGNKDLHVVNCTRTCSPSLGHVVHCICRNSLREISQCLLLL